VLEGQRPSIQVICDSLLRERQEQTNMSDEDTQSRSGHKVCVPDLKQKMHLLQEDSLAGRVSGLPDSEKGLADKLGIPRSTLRDWLHGNNKKEMIDKDYSDRIAGLFQFPAGGSPSRGGPSLPREWAPWAVDGFEAFKTAFHEHAQALLDGKRKPADVNQFLARLQALQLQEQLAVDVAESHFVIAAHPLHFSAPGEGASGAPQDADRQALEVKLGKKNSKLHHGERAFAGLAFVEPRRNDWVLPWKLGVDLDLGADAEGLYVADCVVSFRMSGAATANPVGERPAFPGTLSVRQFGRSIVRGVVSISPFGGPEEPGLSISARKGPAGSFSITEALQVVSANHEDKVEALLIVPLSGLKRWPGRG
jgi:hypothetical protein